MRFVHTADNHIDMPLTSLPPQKASLRKAQRRASFSKIIDYTIQSKADMLLISGDLFHTSTPSSATYKFVCEEFERLGDIKVFIALGNHDYGIKPEIFPTNVHVFQPHFERIVCADSIITGVSFCSESADFALSIPHGDKKGENNILVMHADTSNSGTYNPVNKDTLPLLGYDYIALGHVHGFHDYKPAFYPGCHDGGGFDETGIKGFISGTISHGVLSWEFIESSSLTYETFDFDISGYTSSMAIATDLSKKISRGIYQVNLVGTACTGFTPNIAYIENAVSEDCFHIIIRDCTIPEVDITSGSMYRFFCEHIKNNYTGDVADLALKYGISALKGAWEDI